LLRLRIEDIQARGARIEMDVVSAVMDGWAAAAVVEPEVMGHEIEQAAREWLRNLRDSIRYRDPGAAKDVFDIGRNANTRVLDQLKRLIENALDQSFFE
jgi:hypothetical protein